MIKMILRIFLAKFKIQPQKVFKITNIKAKINANSEDT
jgi:hypothetical protein